MKTLALLALTLFATPAAAQHIDPDWCWTCADSREHFASGAGLDLGLQIVAPRWSPAVRVGIVTLVGAAYEAGQADAGAPYGPGYGFGPKDLILDVAGAVTVEILGYVVRRLL